MSVKSFSDQRAVAKNWGTVRSSVSTAATEWVRPSDWLPLTAPADNERKFVGLHAIYPDANFLALSAAGDYTVDWGDGVVENFASGVTAQHVYDYATYDVSNATLCGRGYKQAIVQVYPQEGQTFSALNLHVKHNQANLQAYSSGFLDIALAGADLTDVRIGSQAPGNTGQVIRFADLERVNLVKTNLRQCEGLFRNCDSLMKVVDVNTTTDAPLTGACTFTDTGDEVTFVNHGRRSGDSVIFTSIAGTTGIAINTRYFVINATTDTFQVSSTFGGSALALTGDSFGTVVLGTNFGSIFSGCRSLQSIPLLNTAAGTDFGNMFNSCYSLQSIPLLNTVAGTSFNGMFNSCYSLQSIPLLNTVAGTSFNGMFNSCYSLQSIPLLNTAAGTDFGNMFNSCFSLQSIPLLNTAAGTDFGNMFNSCFSLQSIPLLNTAAGTNFTSMFNSCFSLQSIPLLNTAAGTNFGSMFSGCRSLQNIPLLNTATGTNFTGMLSSCYSLQSIPLLNTAAGTNFTSMFNSCYSLQSIPLLNTAAGTNFGGMFSSCYSLQSIPLLNTAAGTNFGSMFNSCYSLQSIPLLNTAAGTSFNSMFNNCPSLQSIPLLNTAAGTNFGSMFNSCYSLQSIPLLNTAAGTNFSGMFSSCPSLHSIDAFGARLAAFSVSNCKLSEAALTNIIDKLGNTVGTQILTISSNFGAVTSVSQTGTTTAGSTTVTMSNTSGIEIGMQVTGTGTPSTSARGVTFTSAGSTVSLMAHGLSNGDEVSFTNIVTTTGITINTIYFVVNATADTFQVALTAGGDPITLTNNGTGMIRYKAIVAAINPNVSVTLSRPASGSSTSTLAFRTLKTNTALLKGWSVTG